MNDDMKDSMKDLMNYPMKDLMKDLTEDPMKDDLTPANPVYGA